jgi:hypothetical protein
LPERRRHRLWRRYDLPVDLTVDLLLLLKLLPLDLVSQRLQICLADRVDAWAYRLKGLRSRWQTGDSGQAQSTDNSCAMPFHRPSPYRSGNHPDLYSAAGREVHVGLILHRYNALGAPQSDIRQFRLRTRNGPPKGSPFQCTAGGFII